MNNELGYGQSTTVPVGGGYFVFVITRYKSGYEAHLEDRVGQEWGWESGGQDLDEVIADCEETAAAMVAANYLDCTGAESRARAAAYIGPDALMGVIVDVFRERYPHAPTPEIKEMPEMDGAPHGGAQAHAGGLEVLGAAGAGGGPHHVGQAGEDPVQVDGVGLDQAVGQRVQAQVGAGHGLGGVVEVGPGAHHGGVHAAGLVATLHRAQGPQ